MPFRSPANTDSLSKDGFSLGGFLRFFLADSDIDLFLYLLGLNVNPYALISVCRDRSLDICAFLMHCSLFHRELCSSVSRL